MFSALPCVRPRIPRPSSETLLRAMDTSTAVLAGDWPLTSTRNRVGERIRELIEAGSVRHDILVDRSNVGRIIGQRGSTLGALLQVASTPHQPQPQPQPRPSFGPSLSFSLR